jgi:type IV secretory pathway VirB10-like protein
MAFNTASFVAGVGTVVVVLSTGFAGGYFIAAPDHAPPNRLQRVASDATSAKTEDTKAPVTSAAPVTMAQAKPEGTAAIVTPAQAQPTPASETQLAPAPSPAPSPRQAATEQSPSPQQQVAATKPDPAPAAPEQNTGQAKAQNEGTDRLTAEKDEAEQQRAARIAEAKTASRKRTEARKFAEQQRRQRELDVAAGAVRHIIHDRDGYVQGPDGDEVIVRDGPPDDVVEVAEPREPEARPYGFFGR